MNNVQKNFKKQMNKGLKELRKNNKDTYNDYMKQNHLDNVQARIAEEKRDKISKAITTPFKVILKIFEIIIALILALFFIVLAIKIRH